jgi:hypothetical protein
MATISDKPARLTRDQIIALRGLRLPTTVLKQLQQTGIYCEPAVSIEHQSQARKYVIRGVESGGAVAGLGLYVGFAGEDGQPLAWLQRINAVGRNGLHAVVVAPEFFRLQMFRSGQTYELLITEHRLEPVAGSRRPVLQNRIVFRGTQGTLALELWGNDSHFSGQVAPAFLTRSGEPLLVPGMLLEAVHRMTTAVCCVGCHHSHLLQPGESPALREGG